MPEMFQQSRDLSSTIKSSHAEEFDAQIRLSPQRQIRQHFSNDAGELEAMAAESARDGDALAAGMAIDDEMMVRTVGVEARPHRQERAVRVGQQSPEDGPKCFFVSRQNIALDAIRIGRKARRMVRDLETGILRHHRDSVMQASIRIVDRPDRQSTKRKIFGLFRPNPPDSLAGDVEFGAEIAQ
jgi:hypothetical protein